MEGTGVGFKVWGFGVKGLEGDLHKDGGPLKVAKILGNIAKEGCGTGTPNFGNSQDSSFRAAMYEARRIRGFQASISVSWLRGPSPTLPQVHVQTGPQYCFQPIRKYSSG